MRIFLIVCTLLLCGCNILTPNKAVEITSKTLYDMAVQADKAEQRGIITDAQENALIDRLIDAQKLLEDTYTAGQVPGCTEGQTKQQCLQAVLDYVEAQLLEAEA